jgi:type IV fimbrial biogenesis protein FimT
MKRAVRGFSILEIIIVVAVLGVLLGLGVPSFFTYTQNLQIRVAAEAITAGLQIAKNEAIRRNALVQLSLDPTQGTAWSINLGTDPNANPLQTRDANEGSVNVTRVITPQGATNAVTFNGMGRIVAQNADGTPPMTQIDLDNPKISTATDRRPLRILLPIGGAVRMCDPKVSGTDPRTC